MAKPGERADPADDLLLGFAAGESIYEAGGRDARMFIIHQGEVEVTKKIGPHERRLALLGRGDFFGERSLLEDLPREAGARAVCDCRLLPIDASTFDQMLRRYPEVAVRMLRRLSRRLRRHEEADERAMAIAGGFLSPAGEAPPSGEEGEAPAAPRARLVHPASAGEFPLPEGEVTQIGRFDSVTGSKPEVDLGALDPRHSLSRRHAKIWRRDGRFFLAEHIGTANGTFVGGRKLRSGEECELRHGDRLRFGMVELEFRLGS